VITSLPRPERLCIIDRRLKGKPNESWGRKTTGLRDYPRTAGLPVANGESGSNPEPQVTVTLIFLRNPAKPARKSPLPMGKLSDTDAERY
jgi:hypothetical protein